MAQLREDGVLIDRWEPVFRHAAGRVSSQFLAAIRAERRLLGWKTRQPDAVSMPPKYFGPDGEWVDVGPGATLLSAVPPSWLTDSGEPNLRTFVLGRVHVDGVTAPMYALLKLDQSARLPERGTRLAVGFADAAPPDSTPTGAEFWFEVASPMSQPGGAT